MSAIPRFVPNSSKALEVIVWLASAQPNIDVYHLVKAVFFADKIHLSQYGRPIAGDNYDAAPFGPLAQVIYGIIKAEPIEMLALGGNGDLPFSVDQRHRVTASREANARKLSKSDIDALRQGLACVSGKNFQDLFDETHQDPAYLNASRGRMDPRDFLPQDLQDRQAKAQDILESAEYVAF